MSSPVQLSDLDLATVANDGDLALIRKSDTTDYKVTVQVLRNISIAGLPSLSPRANSPNVSDLMIVARGGINSKCVFGSIGFQVGTRIWFYQSGPANSTSPIYWKIVPDTGDTLLSVLGGSTYNSSKHIRGTWQQTNHTLTTAEIPSHTHRIRKTKKTTGSSNDEGPLRGKSPEDDANTATRYATSEATGGGSGHNHGDTWRPRACVGLICEKVL